MTGESQHAFAIKESDTGSKEQDKGLLLDHFSEKAKTKSVENYKSESLVLLANSGGKFVTKEKEYPQREAVIRPQQTGKIDFKSLQNRPKFPSNDRTWSNSKTSPQSPTGKKTRDKGKKSVKSERSNPQQLYRLGLTNCRSNPTIGIAYPQQKVTPPKKLEVSRGPISGSYSFHVPSIPERPEAGLQQQELSYTRCFQESSSSFTSTNYTSQASSAAASVPVSHHPASTQHLGLLQGSSVPPGGQLHPAEFNGTSSWQPSEKTFNGANYGGTSQKLRVFTEGNKTNTSFVPLPFQYEYPSLPESATDSFPCDQSTHPVHYIDISVSNTQMSQNPFVHSAEDRQKDAQISRQFDLEQPEGRLSYPQPLPPPQQPQYLQAQHGTQPSLHCYKGRIEHSDSEALISSSSQLEQTTSNLTDNSTTFRDNPGVALVSVNKSLCPSKDTNPRQLAEENSHRVRNMAQDHDSQMHSASKPCSSSLNNTIHIGSAPMLCGADKSISRLSQTWGGDKKVFSSLDQNSAAFHSNLSDKSQFQCQSATQQGHKNRRMPWQPVHLTSAMPNQNRIELSRQLSNQKVTFLAAASEWQDEPNRSLMLNSPDSFHGKGPSENFTDQQESIKQNCNPTPVFPYSGAEAITSQVCDARGKPLYFGQKQSLPRAMPRASHTLLQVPPVGLSPSDSPLPSPMQNAPSSSTCSSLSPASTSPVISSEDNQFTTTGPLPQFYHQHQGKMLTPSDHLNSDLQHFHSNISRTALNPSERTKEDTLSNLHNIKYKASIDSAGEQQPPPSYSAHQLLASSLVTNLDQLDVLLTCKQCDQNFSNLTSFLDHKQYCHTLIQKNEFKNEPNDPRKYQNDSAKSTMSGTASSLSRYPSDMHLSLLGLNKNGELMSDSEIKGESKDDPSKLSLFAVTNSLPVSLPDLEMDDAKLDSLITEALNGLGYQSDNAEIDSSFIDAFADDEPMTAKVTGSMQMVKSKDCVMFDSKSKHLNCTEEKSQTQGRYLYDSDRESLNKSKKRASMLEKTLQDIEQEENTNIKETIPRYKARGSSSEMSIEKFEIRKEKGNSGDKGREENKKNSRLLVSSRFTERTKVKRFQESYSSITSTIPEASCSTPHSVSQKTGVKYSKKRKAGGGTWSKELIHKIVQQKNKLHAKGTKNQQFSLVMEKISPVAQNPKFEEYDYVSDSDEDYGPLKIVHQGRLGHSRHYKYTYSKEYQSHEQRNKANSIPWNCESKESLEVKVAENISPTTTKQIATCRVRRRRSSRSSTSSEHSTPTSISCESVYSPKNTDRTDSDSEKGLAMKNISSSNVVLMDYFVHDVYETSTVETCKEPSKSSQLFSRNTKRYGSAKFLLSANINSCRIGMESASELSNTSTVSKSLTRYSSTGVSSQEKEQPCSANALSIAQSAEQCSSSRLDDTKFNEPFKLTINDSPGAHPELLPIEVTPDTDSTNSVTISGRSKNGVLEREELEYKKSAGTISNSYKDLLSSAETPAIPANNHMSSFDHHVDHKSTMICISPVDEVHHCPSDLQDPVVPKEMTMPDLIEADQGLIKSPLPFDTSSLFADLTVSGFDSSLYTDIPMSNDSFNAFGPRNDKKELFESTFSPKDWGVMTDVTPALRSENPQFKDLSEKTTFKKNDSCHLDLNLPDKILDYSSNPNSNISEDELEIKKIVTELENKLQTAKDNSSLMNASEVSRQLGLSQTSALHLDNEADNEPSATQVTKTAVSKMETANTPSDSNLIDKYVETDSSWSSSFTFGLLAEHQPVHTSVHDHSTIEPSCVKKHTKSGSAADSGNLQSNLKHVTEDSDAINESFTDKSEAAVDNETYDDNLMQCLEVISDTVLKKPGLTAGLEESKLSQFLNPELPCDNDRAAEDHSEAQPTQRETFEIQRSQKSELALFPNDNTNDCPLVDESVILPKPRETKAGSKTFELGSNESKDMTVKQDLTGSDNSQIKINSFNVSESQGNVIEEKIRNDRITKPVVVEGLQLQEDSTGALRERDSASQQQQFLQSSNMEGNEEKPILHASRTMLLVSLPNTDQFEEEKYPKIPHHKKSKAEATDNLDCSLVPSGFDTLSGGSTESGLVACHLLETSSTDKLKQASVRGEPCKFPPSTPEFPVKGITDCHSPESDMELTDHKQPMSTLAEHNLVKNPLGVPDFEDTCKPEYGDIPKQVLADLITSPLHGGCTNVTLENGESCISHGNSTASTFSARNPVLHSIGEIGDKCNSQRLWNNFEALSPISKDFDVNASEMETCSSAQAPISGMSDLLAGLPHVDLGMGENKPSECGACIPSDLPLISTYEQSDCLIVRKETLETDRPNEQPQYQLKQTSLDFKEMSELSQHLEQCSTVSSCALTENMESQTVCEKSNKDSSDRWELSLNLPLTYSSPLNPVSPLQGDKDSLNFPAVMHTVGGLCSLNTSLQNKCKSKCTTASCPQCKKSCSPSINNEMLELPTTDVDLCQPHLETIAYMDLHGSLLRKAEVEKVNLDLPLSESDVSATGQMASDDQGPLEPILMCAGEAAGNSQQSESLMAKGSQCEMNQKETKAHSQDSGNKFTYSKKSSKQGTILCEICCACFRTIPGLKRHKASKHATKSNGNTVSESMALNPSKGVTVSTKQLETGHRGDPPCVDYHNTLNVKPLESCIMLPSVGILSTNRVSMEKNNSNFGGTESEKVHPPTAEGKETQAAPHAMGTFSKGSEILKNRRIDNNSSFTSKDKGNPDQFNDELLNILKTDILQAITPNFPTAPQGLRRKQPEDQENLNQADDIQMSIPGSLKFKLTSDAKEIDAACSGNSNQNETVSEWERSAGPKEMNNTESNKISISEKPKNIFSDIKDVCEQKLICSEKDTGTETIGEGPVEIKCEKSTCLTDEADNHSLCFKNPSTNTPQPSLGLEALLDDERTFSQLFPRDEAIIRKKCTRVYGKKNKKQKIEPNLPLVEAHLDSNIALGNEKQLSESDSNQALLQLGDSCKYETISMDHAIMLDMCHKSTLKNDFEKTVYSAENLEDHNRRNVENNEDLGVGDFPKDCKTGQDWNDSKTDIVSGSSSSDTQMAFKSEDSVANFPAQFTDSSSTLSNDLQDSSSLFPSIDLQNLNSTFQLPELPLYDSSNNLPLVMPISNDSVDDSHSIKSTKKPTERRGRKRNEGALKLRDKQYKCKVCFTWFLTLGELNFHKLSHNPSPPPTCYMCVQRKFSSREQLRDHLREKHAKNKAGIWTCGMCLKEISDVWMYNEHLREHATQFARKGQTQNSILGLPGCFMQEAAVKSFITSIMQHRPNRASKGEKSKGSPKEDGKTINLEQKPKTTEGDETAELSMKGPTNSSGKQSTPSPLKAQQKADTSQKNLEMHPNCKDPSRDCHHCGKQFPKPFKLQRHLVVHSLQKIFLCHKCPIFYQEAKELKDHLRNEHEEVEEPDSKHTTLYTCELCADVMHVIKKSFICSTCNYTFSKKEQFDRHMEKHLTEGNHILRFRGGVRPSKPLSSYAKNGEFDLPPSKKRKIKDTLLETSSDSNLGSISSLQFMQSGESQALKPSLIPPSHLTTGDSSSGHKDTSIKKEDTVEDFSEMMSTFDRSQHFMIPKSGCLPPSAPKSQTTALETCDTGEESPTKDINLKHVTCSQSEKQITMLAVKDCSAAKGESEINSTEKKPMAGDSPSISKVDLFEDSAIVNATHSVEDVASTKGMQSVNTIIVFNATNSPEDSVTTVEKLSSAQCTKEVLIDECSSLTPEVQNLVKDGPPADTKQKSVADKMVVENLRQPSDHKQKNENDPEDPTAVTGSSAGQEGDILVKENSLSKQIETTKQSPDSSPRRTTESLTNKIKQKKRKDPKTFLSSKGSTPVTRENLDMDFRNIKKVRLQSPSKGEGVIGYKNANAAADYPMLSSVKDDITSNKIFLKHKAGLLNSQTKKAPFSSYPLKKAENTRQVNGDHKGKKSAPVRPLPPSRTSMSSVNSPLSKCKSLSGMRSVEPQSYRTAESQSHLLSQLFGQKLTSFKIPLRKDTSEPLN
ncbi:uncharacterized protein LOC125706037 [Brienomyrus brachyistius]|uniref:uncharacterized protein LOC125706037 n=1 Tax=Brienomyrus brachyistius TaxID=42636 RepID=UPI0020B3B2F4|nr:uncharacterized protein LOC125706037 [Brienomyrus brachyistius]XP_048828427.1 uncharacterized protein LOC125706037 [Brienomyrus brachyistius]XP_048828428.1 uncharacterized protein LOC125706037 [Brienomyrus brachyistius]XP_048828429.1 uncharacterized protein LOC125706037 [Brienomyrus brachyistius]XP_048828430.1 uncharacterized protein LOC125706037 [Brienomyrus brachyistius]